MFFYHPDHHSQPGRKQVTGPLSPELKGVLRSIKDRVTVLEQERVTLLAKTMPSDSRLEYARAVANDTKDHVAIRRKEYEAATAEQAAWSRRFGTLFNKLLGRADPVGAELATKVKDAKRMLQASIRDADFVEGQVGKAVRHRRQVRPQEAVEVTTRVNEIDIEVNALTQSVRDIREHRPEYVTTLEQALRFSVALKRQQEEAAAEARQRAMQQRHRDELHSHNLRASRQSGSSSGSSFSNGIGLAVAGAVVTQAVISSSSSDCSSSSSSSCSPSSGFE